MRCIIPSLFAGLVLAMVIAGHRPAGAGDYIDCAIQDGPCMKTTGSGIEVLFDVTPRPAEAMRELEFSVSLRKKGKPLTGASLLLDLSMPGMFMGNNQPRLFEGVDGIYRGRGVIPRCPTGSRIWNAFIAVRQGSTVEQVTFLFEVQ
jgi:hypothetical protein